MNAFEKMKERLMEEGWFVGWNLPCCQSCAWSAVPDYLGAVYTEDGYLAHPETGKRVSYPEYKEVYPNEVDLSKVLFNHSQDCEVYIEGEECSECLGEGEVENPDYDEDDKDSEEWIDCPECFGMGEISEEGFDPSEYDTSVSGFVCMTPEQACGSYFCFDGSKKGVENFKAIMPIIEECGVSIHWNGTGDSRIELSWD